MIVVDGHVPMHFHGKKKETLMFFSMICNTCLNMIPGYAGYDFHRYLSKPFPILIALF